MIPFKNSTSDVFHHFNYNNTLLIVYELVLQIIIIESQGWNQVQEKI